MSHDVPFFVATILSPPNPFASPPKVDHVVVVFFSGECVFHRTWRLDVFTMFPITGATLGSEGGFLMLMHQQPVK